MKYFKIQKGGKKINNLCLIYMKKMSGVKKDFDFYKNKRILKEMIYSGQFKILKWK